MGIRTTIYSQPIMEFFMQFRVGVARALGLVASVAWFIALGVAFIAALEGG